MIASFPMYLRAENNVAHAAYWELIREALEARGIPAPDTLDNDARVPETWGRDDLVLGQICGYPFRMGFADKTTLIGVGDYGLAGSGPGEYYSVFIVRADDPRTTVQEFANARFAYNAADSQSGWVAPTLYATARGFTFTTTIQTGAHRHSAMAVAENRADLAALDAITWRDIQRWDGFSRRLHTIAHTKPTPGLSFITAGVVDSVPYRHAMQEALAALPQTHRLTLGLKGIVPVTKDLYMQFPIVPPPMV